jgi:hypothetical protein
MNEQPNTVLKLSRKSVVMETWALALLAVLTGIHPPTIAPDAPPGVYRLRTGLAYDGGQNRLSARAYSR